MSELTPTIEIGNRYLWMSSPIELICESCGFNFGNGHGDIPVEVVIISAAQGLNYFCYRCQSLYKGTLEGWYEVSAANKASNIWIVPYTHLSEIKEEDDLSIQSN